MPLDDSDIGLYRWVANHTFMKFLETKFEIRNRKYSKRFRFKLYLENSTIFCKRHKTKQKKCLLKAKGWFS